MIYLIADIDKTYCKIGVAVEPSKRLLSIQTGCPLTLELLYAIKGMYDLEQELHRMFKVYHIRGEWFRYHEDIVETFSFATTTPIEPVRKDNPWKKSDIKEDEVLSVCNVFVQRYSDTVAPIKRSDKQDIATKLAMDVDKVSTIVEILKDRRILVQVSAQMYKVNPPKSHGDMMMRKGRALEQIKAQIKRKSIKLSQEGLNEDTGEVRTNS